MREAHDKVNKKRKKKGGKESLKAEETRRLRAGRAGRAGKVYYPRGWCCALSNQYSPLLIISVFSSLLWYMIHHEAYKTCHTDQHLPCTQPVTLTHQHGEEEKTHRYKSKRWMNGQRSGSLSSPGRVVFLLLLLLFGKVQTHDSSVLVYAEVK